MVLCVTSVYAKEFPDGLNNTKWKQTNLKNNKNYTVFEFSGRFETYKDYKNNKLDDVITDKMTDYQIRGNLLFVWYEGIATPSIYEIRYDLTEYGEVVLLYYGFNTKDKDSWISAYIPLVEEE